MKLNDFRQMRQQITAEFPEINLNHTPVFPLVHLCAYLIVQFNKPFLEKLEMQPGEFECLMILLRQGPPFRTTPSQIRRECMVTQGTITHRLDRLTEQGRIRREFDDTDRRSVQISLTEDGLTLIRRALRESLERNSQALSRLSDKERQDLLQLLMKLAEGLEERLTAADLPS